MILEGVLAIVEGLNPKLIRTKLEAYQKQQPASEQKRKTKTKLETAGEAAAAEGCAP